MSLRFIDARIMKSRDTNTCKFEDWWKKCALLPVLGVNAKMRNCCMFK
jgi:hypothetical protein